MSRYVKVGDSDYKVSVTEGGTITLDTGVAQGLVKITGNLIVEGETTTVNTTEMSIEDRIITLNSGETLSGISTGDNTAGFEIKRGSLPTASLLFDENLSYVDSQTPFFVPRLGQFVFKDKDPVTQAETLVGIRTNAITTGSNDIDLVLVGEGTAVATVKGTVNYERQVFQYTSGTLSNLTPIDDDIIPNAKALADFVDGYFILNPPEFLKVDNSSLQLYDQDVSAESILELKLDGVVVAQWTKDHYRLQDIDITNNIISTHTSDRDLILQSLGSESVVVDGNLAITVASADPVSAVDRTKVYVKDEAYGGTGVFFVNKEETRDELVSRRKAIAYSMIF
jgi:hypothetical protein